MIADDEPSTARRRRSWLGRNWDPLVGAALLVVGIVLALTAPPASPPTFGWFAYQPLAENTFVPPPGMSLQRAFSYLVIVAGALWITAVVAYRIGRRSRR